jgi:hypothetical protein
VSGPCSGSRFIITVAVAGVFVNVFIAGSLLVAVDVLCSAHRKKLVNGI